MIIMQKIETTTAHLIDEEDILYVVFKKDADVNESDVKEISAARIKLLRGKKQQLVLADIRNIGFLSNEAKKHGASEEVVAITKAMALITKSLATKIMANFFILINKPAHPTRMFRSVEDAKKWLKKFEE